MSPFRPDSNRSFPVLTLALVLATAMSSCSRQPETPAASNRAVAAPAHRAPTTITSYTWDELVMGGSCMGPRRFRGDVVHAARIGPAFLGGDTAEPWRSPGGRRPPISTSPPRFRHGQRPVSGDRRAMAV